MNGENHKVKILLIYIENIIFVINTTPLFYNNIKTRKHKNTYPYDELACVTDKP